MNLFQLLKNMSNVKLNTLTVNGVDYVPADSVKEEIVTPIDGTPVGLYCIVRCCDAGVWAGVVKEHDGKEVTLVNARRLWQWKAADGITLSAVSQYGIANSKIPAAVEVVWVEDACEIIPCTKTAENNIKNYEIAKQS